MIKIMNMIMVGVSVSATDLTLIALIRKKTTLKPNFRNSGGMGMRSRHSCRAI